MTSTAWLLVAVGLIGFVTGLDNTVLTVALPTIQSELGIGTSTLQWIGTAYILSFSALLLVGGQLSDRFGRRPVLLAGMVIYGSFAFLSSLAPDETWLIACRLMQGVGAALTLPSSLSVLAFDLSGRWRHLGSGIWTAAIAISLALGPVVGGAIAQYWDWHGIFLINLPLLVLAFVLVVLTVPRRGGRHAEGRPVDGPPAGTLGVDVPGTLLSTVALAGITFTLIQVGAVIEGMAGAGEDEATTPVPVLLLVGGIAVLAVVGFLAVERRVRFPVLDLKLFANRVYNGGTISQILWGLGINGVFFFTPLFLQNVLGFSETAAGLVFVPLALSLILSVPVAASIAARFGAHVPVSFGLVLVAAGLLANSLVPRDGGFLALMPGMLLLGIGSGLTTPLTSAVLGAVRKEKAGSASALLGAGREVSGVLGIAVTGVVVLSIEGVRTRAGAAVEDAFLGGYRAGLVLAAVLTLVGALVTWYTVRTRGEELPEAAHRGGPVVLRTGMGGIPAVPEEEHAAQQPEPVRVA